MPGPPPSRLRGLLQKHLRPVFTPRFLKFATVGASGVVVNVGVLKVLSGAGVQDNLASAAGIEVSILSNFLINHRWTFADRHDETLGFWRQAGRFHLVSFGGATINFTVFVALNLMWFVTRGDPVAVDAYLHEVGTLVELWIVRPLRDPPDVGWLKYVSQLIGIGTAMFWNYLVNFHWTWKVRSDD